MCGRSACASSGTDLLAKTKTHQFNHQRFYQPSHNVGPEKAGVVLVNRRIDASGGSGSKCLETMRWGLRAKQETDKALRINARAETVARLYKKQVESRRCAIICDGFYEWINEGEKKRPYYVSKGPGEVVYFAGIYEDDEGRGVERNGLARYSVVTVRVSQELEWLHDRMPAVLEPSQVRTGR